MPPPSRPPSARLPLSMMVGAKPRLRSTSPHREPAMPPPMTATRRPAISEPRRRGALGWRSLETRGQRAGPAGEENMHMFRPPHHDLTLLPDLQCTPTYLLIVRRRVRPRRPGGHGGVWLDPWREPHSGWRRARPLGTPSRGRRRRHLSGGACARTARRLWFVAGGARLVRLRVKGGYCRVVRVIRVVLCG